MNALKLTTVVAIAAIAGVGTASAHEADIIDWETGYVLGSQQSDTLTQSRSGEVRSGEIAVFEVGEQQLDLIDQDYLDYTVE